MATTSPVQPQQSSQGFAATPPYSSQVSTCPPGHIRMQGRCVMAQTSQRPTGGTDGVGMPPGRPAPAPTALGERTPRWTDAQRASIGENRRARAAGARFGTSFAEMGLRPYKEQGQAYLKRAELHAQQGPFSDFLANWDVQWRNGEPWLKAKANQVGRQAEGGDVYRPASEVLSPGHWAAFQRTRAGSAKGNARRAFIESNNLQGTPGGGMDAWIHQRYLNGLKADPSAPGYVVNRFGDQYLASNRILQGLRPAGGAGGAAPAAGRPDIGGVGASGPFLPGAPAAGGGLAAHVAPAGAAGAASGGVKPKLGKLGKSGPFIPGQAAPGRPAPGAPGAPAPTGPQSGDPFQDEITNYLRQQLGSGGPFGEGETAAARASLRSATEGGVDRAREEAQFDAIRSGMARSPASQRRFEDIRRGAEQDYSRGSTQIRLEHATKNFEARMSSLSAMSAQLQNARQFAIAQAQTELERTRIAQNYDIALRNISMAQQQLRQQMSMFQQSQAQQASQFGQTMDLNRDQFDWTRTQGSCPVQQADGTTVTVPIPCSQLAGGFL